MDIASWITNRMLKNPKSKKSKKKEISIDFVGVDGKSYQLTLKEQMFCKLYLETKGNGTEAAYQVYKCKNRMVAAAVAYEYLRKPQIVAYVNALLEQYGFNDDNVTKQHLFTLNQYGDLNAKNKAIDMFYKLKGNYAPEKLAVSLNEDELDARLADVRAKRARLRTRGTGTIVAEGEGKAE